MASEPGDRPASAGELAEALERGLAEERTGPTLLAPGAAQRRRGAPRWLPVAAAVAGLAVVGGGAFLALSDGEEGGSPQKGSRPAKEPPAAKPSPEREAPREEPAAAPAPAREEPAGDPVSLNDRGYALMKQGRYDEAIPLLQSAVESYGEGSQDLTYAYALFNLGQSLRLAGRADEAVPILERRLQIPNQTKLVRKELKQAQKAAR